MCYYTMNTMNEGYSHMMVNIIENTPLTLNCVGFWLLLLVLFLFHLIYIYYEVPGG